MYTQKELEIWRDRAENGPYRTEGDAHANSPKQWVWINQFAEDFRSTGAEVWIGENTSQTKNMLGIHCAALKGKMYNDKELLDLVISALREQVSTNNDFASLYPDSEDGYAMSGWMLRLFNAYQITGVQDDQIEEYFIDLAYWYKEKIDNQMENNFPNRKNNDYTILGGAAKKGGFNSDEITHINPDGSKGNQIYWVHKWYNNRRSSIVLYYGVVGIELGIQELITSAKMYFKETLMFGTFPDGTMSEYSRNGDYNNPFSGLTYADVNIECLVQLAHRLYLKGDPSLYGFTTNEGIHGSEGGNKNLRLVIDNHLDLISGRKKLYFNSVAPENLLDYETDDKVWVNYTYVCLANHYYKSEQIKQDYTRDFTDKKKGTSGRIWYAWGGVMNNTPGYLFMYGQLEGLVSPEPEIDPGVEPTDDILISSHNEIKEAYQSAFKVEITRKGQYEVWQKPDGTKYILQPVIEIE